MLPTGELKINNSVFLRMTQGIIFPWIRYKLKFLTIYQLEIDKA